MWRGVVVALALASSAFADEMQVIDVEIKDGTITPQRIEVSSKAPVKLMIQNTGQTAAEFESLRLRKEKVLAPGAKSFVVFRKLSPGEYEFYDEFHMDQDTAHGVIVVE